MDLECGQRVATFLLQCARCRTPIQFCLEFDALLENGTGADGLTFALLNAASGAPGLGASGGGLGFSGNSGVAVALDTYQNSQNPSANFVGVATGAGRR